jgi:preprotein translocase SecE subunit
MARDRQRSKARKRARAAGETAPPRKRRRESAARDIGLDDPAIDEAGFTDDAPAPDPLKNAMPDVDQAKAAETGAERPGPDGEEVDLDYGEDFDRAEDQVEIPRDLVQRRTRGSGGEVRETEDHQGGGRVVTFIRACIDELRRVQWPDRKHVFSATAVVLGFCLIAGGWLGLMDAIWQPLINALL